MKKTTEKTEARKSNADVMVWLLGIGLVLCVCLMAWQAGRIIAMGESIEELRSEMYGQRDEIGEYVRSQINALYIPYGPSNVAWISGGGDGYVTYATDRNKICPQDAIQLILDHLGLKFEKQEQQEKVILTKKTKEKGETKK